MANNASKWMNTAISATLIAATTALLLMFKPADAGTLYRFNFGFILFLEALLCGYLFAARLRSKNVSTPLTVMLGGNTLTYVFVCAGIMLVYALLLRHIFGLRYYIAAVIILTVIWTIPTLLLLRQDRSYMEEAETLADRRRDIGYYTEKMRLLASRYKTACASHGIAYRTDSSRDTPVELLTGKISALTPNVFRSEAACRQLDSLADKCGALVAQMETAAEKEDARKIAESMQLLVTEGVAEINMLKNLTRS